MSRIGNMPITIPAGVEVTVDGNHITVKGPKGTLEKDLHNSMKAEVKDGQVVITKPDETTKSNSLHGLTRTLVNNMITGVVEEYKVELKINGVGYRAQKQGTKLSMNLGYSHPVVMEAPQGITFDVPDANTVIVRGIDKEVVGQTAAVVRTKRPPEVYKGKGIKYADEHIRRKEGKAGKK
jgi:large subunit ribosomal protein L6